ncbi:MAG: Flp pilus assembly complex ATPase component TadA [Candidatus Omnitrophica bacterium]|nr:Flp pilus assembly complex ATPase component TadA [Candidatus Omnitrophota bacterium]
MLKSAVSKTLTDVLQKAQLLDEAALQAYAAEALRTNRRLGVYLVDEGILKTQDILKALSEHLRLELINLKSVSIDKTVIERVPVKFASYYHFMPVALEGNKLSVAVFEPLDIHSQDDIRAHLGLETRFVLAGPWDIEEALKKYYGLASETIDQILTKDLGKRSRFAQEDGAGLEDIEHSSDDPSVAKLVNQIIVEAFQKRATDIHIEPYRNKVRFRYRIDGVLIDANLPPEARHFLAAILSRIKIMANITITEKRRPHDGSAVVRVKDQTLDLRISTIPTLHGESMVIRLLPTTTTLLDLEKLGFNKDNARKFRELICRPHGVVFVTGPTGSGKTTTLYACLNEINDPNRKIITIEDPIEYEMEGLTQIQVNPGVDFTFASGLRSILRHDPDILMVGEVRDKETADIAIRTALTGHLVFSSLHTNDAASAVTRLVDMGVEPYLVASSVQAFVAQRLVRVICPECRHEDQDPLIEIRQDIVQSLDLSDPMSVRIYKGRGCDHCNNTGYYGRTAIYEILLVDEAIRSAVLDRARVEDIARIAIKGGMRTLRQDGWMNVIQGITTPAEVMNVTMKEDALAGIRV